MLDREKGTAAVAVRLPKVLSIWDTTAYMICSVVGAGIFIAPKGVLVYTGSPFMALVVWLMTGVVSVLNGLCYAELVLTFPSTGSDYNFLQKGYGNLLACLYLWASMLLKEAGGRGIGAFTFATYICQVFYPGCRPPGMVLKLVAILAITFLTALQCYSSKVTVKTTDFLTAAKMLGIATVIGSGIFYYCSLSTAPGTEDHLAHLFDGDSGSISGYILGFYVATWSYGGISATMAIVEEIKKPITRSVLVSVTLSMGVITLVYCMANLAYFTVLSVDEIMASDAVAMSLMDKMFPKEYSWIMPLFVSCSCFGSMNNSIMNSSRIGLAGARNRHLPRPISLVNISYLTPIPALMMNMLLTTLIILTTNIFDVMIYSSYLGTLASILSIFSILLHRYRQPELRRRFKLPMPLILLTITISLFTTVFPFILKPVPTSVSLGILIAGLPVYLLLIWRENTPSIFLRLEQTMTQTAQKIFLATPEELSQDSPEKGKLMHTEKPPK